MTVKGIMISLDNLRIGTGGEGEIYRIKQNHQYNNHCVKIFHHRTIQTPLDKIKFQERNDRIIYMITHPPSWIEESMFKICWPIDAIVENKIVIGFVMPLAFADSIQLYDLCQLRIQNSILNLGFKSFDRTSVQGVHARLKLCTNLAAAVYRIHKETRYTFVDLKPPNLLVAPDGKVSIIDCDSLQIAERRKLLFKATATTPEYMPPEAGSFNLQKEPALHSWDLFSLPVIFYELLLGVHPYMATFSGKFEQSTLFDNIQNSLFVFGSNTQLVYTLPRPHNNFKKIPTTLQMFFRRAFENDKFQVMNRPTAEEWGEELFKHVQHPFTLNPPVRLQKKPISQKKSKFDNVANTHSASMITPSNTTKRDSGGLKVLWAFLIWLIIIIGYAIISG